MNVLFFSAAPTFPESLGGAEISTHLLLAAIAGKGCSVRALSPASSILVPNPLMRRLLRERARLFGSVSPREYFSEGSEEYQSIRCRTGIVSLRLLLIQLLEQFRPDIALSPIGGSEDYQRLLHHEVRRRGIPLCLFFNGVGLLRSAAPEVIREFLGGASLIACSAYLAKEIHSAVGLPSTVIWPIIDPASVVAPTHEPTYLTFINPVPEKGGETVATLARLLPEKKFLVVKSSWSFHDYSEQSPLISAFRALSNVRILEPTTDMRPVYAQSRLVLIPSTVDETFCRVAVEAQMNGIPVVASDRGALADTVGEGGIVLAGDAPVEEYVRAIRELDEPSRYAYWCTRAREKKDSARTSADENSEAFIRLLTERVRA